MKKISIKREQSQAGLSFAEREKFRPQVKNKLLLLLALLMTAATGAWAQDAKHLITATYREQTRSLEQPLPYATTIGELYEAVSGQSFSDLISSMSSVGMPLTGITSRNTSVVSIGELNGASTPVTVKADGEATISIKFGSYALGIFVSATSPLYAYMKDGVKDADKWTVKVGEGQAQALPIGGLKGDGSETVTLKYTGRLKVKGVKATSDEKPAEALPALSITSPSVGQVIGSDGKNYAYGSLPSGVTAVAKICYISGSNGLALALTDEEGQKDWSTANETCAAHTPAFTGGTWKLASLDEWENMITTAGNQTDLRDGFSSVGGTNMEENCYWSSSEVDSESACLYYFGNGQGYSIDDYKDYGYYVRACLAFTVEQSAKPAATVTTAPTGAAIVGVGKSTALVSGGVADGGTLMYAVTTTNTKPTSTAGFSDAVPTAKDITASGKVYVWYYVKADDTHSDSEIAATAIEVPVADIVWDRTNVSDIQIWGTDESYEKEGVTLRANGENISAEWADYGDPTTAGIQFEANESGGYTFTAPTGKKFTKIEMTLTGFAGWDIANLGSGWSYSEDGMTGICKVTWKGTAASTVGLLTGANNFGGERVKSIVFYLSE